MKLTRKNVVELDHVLKTTNYDMPIGARFRYATSSNLKVTGAEIDEINAAFPVPDAFKEYKQKETAVYTEFGVQNVNEIASFEEEKKQAIEAKFDALKEEYADAIDEYQAIEKEKFEFLNETIDINLRTVKVDDVPDIAKDNIYPHWEIWRVLELIVVDD